MANIIYHVFDVQLITENYESVDDREQIEITYANSSSRLFFNPSIVPARFPSPECVRLRHCRPAPVAIPSFVIRNSHSIDNTCLGYGPSGTRYLYREWNEFEIVGHPLQDLIWRSSCFNPFNDHCECFIIVDRSKGREKITLLREKDGLACCKCARDICFSCHRSRSDLNQLISRL